MNKLPKEANLRMRDEALRIIKQGEIQLTRKPKTYSAQIYQDMSGLTYRVRTAQDHILVVVANNTNPDEATLNIEGTDYLLFAMLEKQRWYGKVLLYKLPVKVVADEARRKQKIWLQSNPSTRGNNITFNLWFKGGAENELLKQWGKYRLQDGHIKAPEEDAPVPAQEYTSPHTTPANPPRSPVEDARRKLAQKLGVPPDAIKITVTY